MGIQQVVTVPYLGWMIVFMLVFLLAGYVAGKRYGRSGGWAEASSYAPLELRRRALLEEICPVCGSRTGAVETRNRAESVAPAPDTPTAPAVTAGKKRSAHLRSGGRWRRRHQQCHHLNRKRRGGTATSTTT